MKFTDRDLQSKIEKKLEKLSDAESRISYLKDIKKQFLHLPKGIMNMANFLNRNSILEKPLLEWCDDKISEFEEPILEDQQKEQRQDEIDRLNDILNCKDLKQLKEKYGNDLELLNSYKNGLGFAPGKMLFIENRINTFKETLNRYSHKWQTRNKDFYDLGTYKRLGFDWVNNGHNAPKGDFLNITYNNLTINSLFEKEKTQLVYYVVLSEIAKGASLAFHIAYLNEQLQHQILLKGNTI